MPRLAERHSGLFFWIGFAANLLDTELLLKDALAQNVAFMPGEPFFPDRAQAYTSMRLNFSHVAPEAAAHGSSTLASLVRKRLG